jgi:hypothetical protein
MGTGVEQRNRVMADMLSRREVQVKCLHMTPRPAARHVRAATEGSIAGSSRLCPRRRVVWLVNPTSRTFEVLALASGHPVIASAEAGERWLYCFVDDAFSEY